MQRHSLRQKRLPVGSGMVEAASRVLVNHRMKLSGMRWSMGGGQAVMNLRALLMSGRLDAACEPLMQPLRRSWENHNCPCEPQAA